MIIVSYSIHALQNNVIIFLININVLILIVLGSINNVSIKFNVLKFYKKKIAITINIKVYNVLGI